MNEVVTDYSAAFRQCLVDLDVSLGRKLWRHVSPHLSQPANDAEMLATLHMARTATEGIDARLRFYSHRWMLDLGYPSQLPDRLKPSAERMYPRVVDAVGVSVNSKYPVVKAEIGSAMSNAVLETYADGVQDPVIVRSRMLEARERSRRALGL